MISVTILVKNGERCLKEVLNSLSLFDEVLLYDTGSEDKTLEIARTFPNVTIFQKKFLGFGPSHNEAAHLARNDWILSIDSDEILSRELVREITSLSLDPKCAYSLPFHNFFNGKQIKWCGWHPEKHVRLYHKKSTSFSQAMVHEGVICDHLKEICLKQPLLHYPYDSISDFLIKMERYSSLFAEQSYQRKKSSPWIAITHGFVAFFNSFVLKRGFLGGFEGFFISVYNGHTAFYKYLKLYQANKK